MQAKFVCFEGYRGRSMPGTEAYRTTRDRSSGTAPLRDKDGMNQGVSHLRISGEDSKVRFVRAGSPGLARVYHPSP